VQSFLMQVAINKFFLLNPEKNLAQICRFQEKRTFNSEKWRHRAESSQGNSNYQLKSFWQVKGQFQISGNHVYPDVWNWLITC